MAATGLIFRADGAAFRHRVGFQHRPGEEEQLPPVALRQARPEAREFGEVGIPSRGRARFLRGHR